jgi:hypothetical protein
MKYQRIVSAITAGLALAILLRYLNDVVQAYSANCCSASGPTPSLLVILGAPIGMLIALVPGFVTGWIARARGISSGFAVGFVGSALYSIFSGSAHNYWSLSSLKETLVLATWFLLMCIVAGVFSAAAGGAAQLVRSNNSFKPKPLRGSA